MSSLLVAINMSRLFCKQILWGLILVLSLVVQVAFAQSDRAIKPGDRLSLVCEEEPSLNRDYVVTRDGLMVLSFIGAVEVGGLTCDEAGARIADQLVLQQILRKATIRVSFVGSTTKPVRFAGAVKASGEIPFNAEMTLADVLKIAQPTSQADLALVTVESEGGRRTGIDATSAAGLAHKLRPGDLVFVPVITKTPDVYVLGAVLRPGTVKFNEGLSALAAIEQAGGFELMANRSRVRLERKDQTAKIVDLAKEQNDFGLVGGDRLVVELKPVQKFVAVVGQVKNPGFIEFSTGMTLTQAIADAGGLTAEPGEKIKVILISGKNAKDRKVYDLERIMLGYVGDIKLAQGDRLEVGRVSKKDRQGLERVLGGALVIWAIGR